MKSKPYHYGKHACKSYIKPVGKGFEVGFFSGDKVIFVGNFIHAKEAVGWWKKMNHEIQWFANTYTKGYEMPFAWFSHSLKSHLYRTYYRYLDKLFGRYNTTFSKAFSKSIGEFKRFKGDYRQNGPVRKTYLKAA